ncbi:hypothetical protein [Haloplanus aerogenes]|uniref:Uncharacterized protein n=1 Tax=Haloplanus aerogenes TaxID=660522 RepID=A0A3M0D4I6_9EURY|nr:hypothetical protein [Haloplanus aerogenes]AZH24903.1 hypothetical protein DU502_05760 [Haloplanus aerogenes]RMB13886.1 hypothetical protein ATH50_2328 [Haloplanus aerogenes]
MTLGSVELSRVVRRFRRAVRDPSEYRWLHPLLATSAWLLKLPGMRPRAPKRNVILGLIYLYGLLVLLSIGSV